MALDSPRRARPSVSLERNCTAVLGRSDTADRHLPAATIRNDEGSGDRQASSMPSVLCPASLNCTPLRELASAPQAMQSSNWKQPAEGCPEARSLLMSRTATAHSRQKARPATRDLRALRILGTKSSQSRSAEAKTVSQRRGYMRTSSEDVCCLFQSLLPTFAKGLAMRRKGGIRATVW